MDGLRPGDSRRTLRSRKVDAAARAAVNEPSPRATVLRVWEATEVAVAAEVINAKLVSAGATERSGWPSFSIPVRNDGSRSSPADSLRQAGKARSCNSHNQSRNSSTDGGYNLRESGMMTLGRFHVARASISPDAIRLEGLPIPIRPAEIDGRMMAILHHYPTLSRDWGRDPLM
jgi:hypothetical protein